jgi:hypothetical protein
MTLTPSSDGSQLMRIQHQRQYSVLTLSPTTAVRREEPHVAKVLEHFLHKTHRKMAVRHRRGIVVERVRTVWEFSFAPKRRSIDFNTNKNILCDK